MFTHKLCSRILFFTLTTVLSLGNIHGKPEIQYKPLPAVADSIRSSNLVDSVRSMIGSGKSMSNAPEAMLGMYNSVDEILKDSLLSYKSRVCSDFLMGLELLRDGKIDTSKVYLKEGVLECLDTIDIDKMYRLTIDIPDED